MVNYNEFFGFWQYIYSTNIYWVPVMLQALCWVLRGQSGSPGTNDPLADTGPMHLDSSKICAAPPSTPQTHLGADPACICGPEKGWPHLSSSSCLICKTRIILTQFAALWWRISEKYSGLVLISSRPHRFYLLITSVASFLKKLCIL